MTDQTTVLLAAGGTGGHLFPASALAAALGARGVAVELATDQRALKYGGDFPARAVHQLPSATPTAGGVTAKAGAAFSLLRGTIAAYALLKRLRPGAVVGFGGYPTVPPLLAASFLGIPTIVHDANAVVGRANKFLAPRVGRIASAFPTLGGLDARFAAKIAFTGNPLRPAVIAAAKTPYPDANGPLRVLVTGGSQGARVMADVVPAAFATLAPELRGRFALVMQARGEDGERVRAALKEIGMSAEIAPFFADLPARMAAAHLVVGRSGASTVSELAAIGRPSILVPFPHSLDQDQAANAKALASSGAATVVLQANFTPAFLAEQLQAALADPGSLAAKAASARGAGVLDAAERLADLTLEAAKGRKA